MDGGLAASSLLTPPGGRVSRLAMNVAEGDPGPSVLSPAFWRRLAAVGTGVSACGFAGTGTAPAAAAPRGAGSAGREIHEMGVVELQQAMAAGSITATQVTAHFIARIADLNPRLNAVVEVNLEAVAIAARCDSERAVALAADRALGPMHGICVLLKDNIDTGDRMRTTAGSLALLASQPPLDAPLVAQLRRAGAVILGKANLSEWANFRSQDARSGWSARGGQTRNPHVLDCSPGGSSAGPAAAVAAGLCTVAVGTETNGSIVCPAAVCGVVGLKPTKGVVPGGGIVPLSTRQDTAGPIARSVADAAVLLGAVALHPAPPAPPLSSSTDGSGGGLGALSGRRIGLIAPAELGVSSPAGLAACNEVAAVIARAGAILVEIPHLVHTPPSAGAAAQTREIDGETTKFERGHGVSDTEFDLLLWEFARDIEGYLATRRPRAGGSEMEVPRTLE